MSIRTSKLFLFTWQNLHCGAGGCSWYPVSWHHPTGYRSGDSQSTHWSYSSSHPSKCILNRRWIMRVTVATHTRRGSIRSTASSFIPTWNPWFGTSWKSKHVDKSNINKHAISVKHTHKANIFYEVSCSPVFNISEIFKLNILKWFLFLKSPWCLSFPQFYSKNWVNPMEYADKSKENTNCNSNTHA